MILIFFGPPGAGKGTQANLISKHYNLPHLSTGDILRSKISDKDDLSKKLKDIMEKGQLVSDEFTNEIVCNRIEKIDCKNGFILDGYPRTMVQALFLNDLLKSKKLEIDKIINIELEEKIIIERIISRSAIERRQDDKSEVIKTRIKKYQKEKQLLSDFYFKKMSSNYAVINGNQKIEKINADIMKIIKNANI